ncbi:MAG: putative lipid II flippase FtsW [Candidatus Saccharimonadales bacterium]
MSIQRRRPINPLDDSSKRRHKPDYILLLISIVLLVIGLIVIYSISPALAIEQHVNENYFIIKQLTAIGLGIVAFGIMAGLPFSSWRKFEKPLIVLASLATIVALILPVNAQYPAHRWIRFGGLSLQSVELIKFALLIWLAAFLAQKMQEHSLKNSSTVLKVLIGVLLVLGLVVTILQKDLGSTAVMVAMMAAMCFVAGLPLKRVLAFGGIIGIGAVLAISTSSYRRDRLLTFIHPTRDCQSTGYQACEALITVGSGGVFGKGLAHSVQDYGYLPEASNDSIFAIIAEKFGFVGVSFLICIFLVFFARIKNIIEKAPNDFTRLLMTGILAWLSTQSIINIGAMVGLLPLKGITLPFISYGGTSIIFVNAAVGMAFNISRYTSYSVTVANEIEGENYENTSLRRGNRRPHYAQLSRRP